LAHLYTPMPRKLGERKLATQLRASDDPLLHIWTGLNFIPGVKDNDLLLWHERVGVFIIEIKAVPIGLITRFGWNECEIEDRPTDGGPVEQAHQAMFSLKKFLNSRRLYPYTVSAAAWPEIRRSEWNEHWDDPRVCGSYAESMFFQEDFYSGSKALVERLEYIRKHPNRGEGSEVVFKHKPEDLENLRKALDVSARPRPTESDNDRLKIIENAVTKQERDRVPPRQGKQWLYTGKAGTGKTFRLLRVGFWHATHGCNVLYLCFNKVLAADVQRTLNFSERLGLSEGSIDARDVFDVLQRFIRDPIDAQGHEEWAKAVVELMKEQSSALRKYDTILMDEAQDLHSWAFEMAYLHAAPNATILVASGKGQEMYGEEASELNAFRKTAKEYECRRCFRNTEQISKFAMLFSDADGDLSKIPSLAKIMSVSREQSLLQFERPGGSLPSLICMDDREIDQIPEDSQAYGMLLDEARARQYKELIEHEIRSLREGQRPMDLLILVPSEGSDERKWTLDALNLLEVNFLDYTHDDNRRFTP
jgi:hypothetical protein